MTARGYEFYLRVFNSISHELLHKHTNDDVFDDFPKISDHFPKIFQNCSEGKANVSEHFFGDFQKITEDFRRFSKISEEAPMMFRSCSNISKYFLRDYGTIAMVIILVTMVTIRRWSLHVWRYEVFAGKLTWSCWYFSGVYVINENTTATTYSWDLQVRRETWKRLAMWKRRHLTWFDL